MTWLSLIPPWLPIALVVFGVVLTTVAYLILLERKVASWTQDRIGPNRVGPFGLLQPAADGLKMFVKEDYRPAGADPKLFTIAPMIIMVVAIMSIAVIPWGGTVQRTEQVVGIPMLDPASQVPWYATIVSISGPYAAETPAIEELSDVHGLPVRDVTYRWAFQIANLNIGILFIVATLSLAVYGIVIGGYASNNKYSFLGGLRAAAQMVSYEVPLGLSLLTIVLMFGTLDLAQIVDKQAHYWLGVIPAWNIFCQPLALVMFLICLHAEANRAPFDLPEAEQELVGGYHTEYSSMRLGLLLLAEYAGMITTSAVCVALFFGGWHFPGLTGSLDPASPAVTGSLWVAIIRAGVFFAKVLVIIFIFMWVRWTLPRFRFDQLMGLAWRGLVPVALAMLLATAVVLYAFGGTDNRAYMRISGKMALALLASNVAVAVGAVIVGRLLPKPPPNRRVAVEGSRFGNAAVPADVA